MNFEINGFGGFIFSTIYLVGIIYFAVWLALRPILQSYSKKQKHEHTIDYKLFYLQMRNIINNDEYKNIKEFYNKSHEKKDDFKRYNSIKELLEELREMGYYGEKEFLEKLEKLKRSYNIEEYDRKAE